MDYMFKSPKYLVRTATDSLFEFMKENVTMNCYVLLIGAIATTACIVLKSKITPLNIINEYYEIQGIQS